MPNLLRDEKDFFTADGMGVNVYEKPLKRSGDFTVGQCQTKAMSQQGDKLQEGNVMLDHVGVKNYFTLK